MSNAAMKAEPPAIRLVVWAQLRQTYNIPWSRDTARRRAAQGTFPKPVRVGGHHIAWRVDEIEAWLRNLARAEDAPIRQKHRKHKRAPKSARPADPPERATIGEGEGEDDERS
jgi:predicted DNA-binding transcriptional regulator AlpA